MSSKFYIGILFLPGESRGIFPKKEKKLFILHLYFVERQAINRDLACKKKEGLDNRDLRNYDNRDL